MGGVLSDKQALELELQRDFIAGATALTSSVMTIKNSNKVSNFLAANLGWQRYLWQNMKQTSNAGGIRQTLVERSRAAGSMIRLLAMEKSMPLIRRLVSELKIAAPDIDAVKLQQLVHDQVVIGNYPMLRNVSDSPILIEELNQRLLKHQQNLTDAGVNEVAQAKLKELSVKISNTFDEMRYTAGQAGVDIDRLSNGGYFPIQITDEFEKVWKTKNERWLSGYKSVEESFQKERKTLIPVVLDQDEIASLLHKQLLGRDISEEGAVLLTKAEAEKAREGAEALVKKTLEAEKETFDKLAMDIAKAEATSSSKLRTKISKIAKVEDAKIKGQLDTLRAELKAEGYSPKEIKSIVERERLKLEIAKDDLINDADIAAKESLQKKVDSLADKRKREFNRIADKLKKESSADILKAVEHEQAKIALMEIGAEPGALSSFLARNFSDRQIKRLLEANVLQQIPMLSDELLETYRGLDLGIRGLSDAIILDPEEAIRTYAVGLAKSAEEQNLFRTVFDFGSDAGWVKAKVEPELRGDYIKVGSHPKLKKWTGIKNVDIEDLYIHKEVANQIDTLLTLNTSPHYLQQISTAWNIVTGTLKKSYLLGRNAAYLSGVFMQNVLSLMAGAGSLTQLPLALVDSMRFLKDGWKFGSDKKVFKIGSQDFSISELYREVQLRRGNATADSLSDPREIAIETAKGWSKQARERSKHFNSLYSKSWGDPILGAGKAIGATYNKAYNFLAFTNAYLDNAARWAMVRELAIQGKYDNLDDLMRATDNYFAINADSGRLGNLTGQIYMPFAQFAMNAPGAAVRHAIEHPWRAANMMQLYATASQTDLTEAELPSWLRESGDYFFTAYIDKESGNYGIVMPQNVDFMLGSYEWFTDLARDISGNPRGVTNYVKKRRGDQNLMNKLVTDVVDKSYFGNAIIAAMGFDPRTMERYSPDDVKDTWLGIPMEKSTRSLLLQLAPLTRSLDQALPPELVGRAPKREVNPNTGISEILDQGQPSIFGATPTSGGYRNKDKGTLFSELLTFASGLTITDIDPQQNIIRTHNDFDNQLREVKSARNRLFRDRVASGGWTREQSEKYHELSKLAVVLLHFKYQTNIVADQRGLKPPAAVNFIKNKRNQQFTSPLKDAETIELLREYNNIMGEEPND